jgi:excisionase family DNA binding protein
MDDGLFLTVEEAADRLGLNPETIRRRIRKGSIKAQLIPGPRGDQYQIPVSELTTQEAQIVPVPGLPPTVIGQIANAMTKAVSEAVEPLQAHIEAQAQEINELKEQLTRMEKTSLNREIGISKKLYTFIEESRAERLARSRSWWKFW